MDIGEYKKEIKNLKKNRKRYRPALQKLLDLYNHRLEYDSPFEITQPDDIALFAELLDVGYIEYEAISMTSRFGDIRSMSFTFRYPLTEAGIRYMEEKGLHSIKEYRTVLCMVFFLALLLAAWAFFIFRR